MEYKAIKHHLEKRPTGSQSLLHDAAVRLHNRHILHLRERRVLYLNRVGLRDGGGRHVDVHNPEAAIHERLGDTPQSGDGGQCVARTGEPVWRVTHTVQPPHHCCSAQVEQTVNDFCVIFIMYIVLYIGWAYLSYLYSYARIPEALSGASSEYTIRA